jgi:hypothetical protein
VIITPEREHRGRDNIYWPPVVNPAPIQRPSPTPITRPRDSAVVVRPGEPNKGEPVKGDPGARIPTRPITPVTPDRGSVITVPRRRSVPFDDKPTIVDRYRPAPVPDARDKLRQRERFERDFDRVGTPAPKPPVVRKPGDVVTPTRPGSPVLNPTPPRAGVTPRYRVPGRPVTTPTIVPDRATQRPERTLVRAGTTQRDSAPWTFGRSNRVFHGRGPWGVNAAGRRIYGLWYGRHCAPYSFAWCHVPSWCRWGFYSWPMYYGSYWHTYWPRAYDCGLWSYGWTSSYWCSYDPYYVRRHLWYWPSSVYAPTIVYAGYDSGYSGGYADGGDSHVTIRIEGGEASIDAEGETVRVTPAATRGLPAPSKETLAERHVALADVYFRDGRYQDAADSYLRALSYLADDASIHFALADALFALGDYHYAAFMIGKALDLDPELAELTIDKRTFYADAKAFESQLETLRRYVAEKPYDAAAQLVLGYNLRFSGDDSGAERAFARVLEIDKRSTAAELFLRALAAKKKDGR